MRRLLPNETELVGQWIVTGGTVVADDICARIRQLTNGALVEISRDASGWHTLYRDPQDSRLWERSYPHADLHGGGPPKLTCISDERAKHLFGHGVP